VRVSKPRLRRARADAESLLGSQSQRVFRRVSGRAEP
jgi:hypothetical protein